MLTINPTALRTAANDIAPFAPSGADLAGFASLLRQTQTQTQAASQPAVAMPPAAEAVPALAASTPAQPAPVAHDEASSEPPPPQEPQEPDPAGHARALLRSKLRAADGTGSTPHGPKTDPSTRDTAKAGTTDTGPADKRADAAPASMSSADPALDPSVMHGLSNLQQAASAGGEADTAKRGSGARTDPDAAQAALGDDPGGRVRGHTAGPGATDLKDAAAARAPSQGTDPSTAGLFAQSLAEQRPIEKAPAPSTGSGGGAKDIAALNAAALAPAPGTAAAVAATAPVVLSTPVTAPDFAQELGLRLSVLARDGVQHAEIHLNPAEMGPVSVQIVMDGTQAHVAFGADAAATRHAIEAGLPDLASALRDAGFTLAGGGVSQHAGGRGDGSDSGARSDSGRRTGAGPDAAQRAGAAARRIVTAGGVDLYA